MDNINQIVARYNIDIYFKIHCSLYVSQPSNNDYVTRANADYFLYKFAAYFSKS